MTWIVLLWRHHIVAKRFTWLCFWDDQRNFSHHRIVFYWLHVLPFMQTTYIPSSLRKDGPFGCIHAALDMKIKHKWWSMYLWPQDFILNAPSQTATIQTVGNRWTTASIAKQSQGKDLSGFLCGKNAPVDTSRELELTHPVSCVGKYNYLFSIFHLPSIYMYL